MRTSESYFYNMKCSDLNHLPNPETFLEEIAVGDSIRRVLPSDLVGQSIVSNQLDGFVSAEGVVVEGPVHIGRGVVIDRGVLIEEGVFIGHNTVVREGVKLYRGATIGHNVVIESDTIVGEKTTIQSQCHLTKNAVIGPCSYFGPCVVMINDQTLSSVKGRPGTPHLVGPRIGRGVRIGAGALIMPGVSIGDNAFIGAGSVVTKDVPPGQMWFGSPAIYRREVPKDEWV